MNATPLWKRSIDITVSLAAMPVLAFCTLVVTIMHQICSPGPIFFTQERVGHNGRRFRIYKFRTMSVGAATEAHRAYYNQLMSSNLPMAKLDGKGDKRLVPGGWLLRGSGMDELPQLINVLKGEMSLVGPRPCIPYEYEEYTPWQKQRFNAVPGLTGLWQVSGKNRTTFDEMIRFDREYAENLSFWMDVRIIFMTGPAIFIQIYDARVARRKEARSRKSFAPARSDAPTSVIQSPKVNL